ncbi:hypothetical protein NDU88_000637 [Pleurodeles waltl]|uniref:Uncharacterized protein n=1 Tax=Pleurodeles waltl TaxID=8319 RepID=A0AAV7V5M9_PLEWA|nr:hypothetical protein NDU88_000637 [Pleurodeles waltl]
MYTITLGKVMIKRSASSGNANGSRENTGKKTEEIPHSQCLLEMRMAPGSIPARKQKKYPTVLIRRILEIFSGIDVGEKIVGFLLLRRIRFDLLPEWINPQILYQERSSVFLHYRRKFVFKWL